MNLILCAALIFGFLGLQGQETLSVTGGNLSGNGGTISYTVGQLVYTTNSGINGSVKEGVQQPYEIWVYSEVEENDEILVDCSVFPNPVTDILTLKIKHQKIEKLSYQLYEINGKMIENKKITTDETAISMKSLSSGTFFLKVLNNNKELKYFKIIKH